MYLYANDPHLRAWLPAVADSDFPIQNLPFGVFRHPKTGEPRVCTRLYDTLIDLYELGAAGLFNSLAPLNLAVFLRPSLNDFIALGKTTTLALRDQIARLFAQNSSEGEQLKNKHSLQKLAFHDANTAQMLLPVEIGDYTDFYASRQHATNVGIMFRDSENALLPNWLHLPVGYHGRASSIVVSGTPLHRPKGQLKLDADAPPTFGASVRLDFELEMALIIGKNTNLGDTISTDEAEDYIFGLALFNDWSARDIQQWEYVPLGPFLGKNFGSTLAPWIVVLEALEGLRTPTPTQEPQPLPYLQFKNASNYEVQLEVAIQPADHTESYTVSRSNFKHMYWNMAQQIAHHSIGGCNMRIGDLLASGTISGDTPDSYGSMLELAWRGTRPVKLGDTGLERKFIQDHDTVILRGHGITKEGIRIGFGEAKGKVMPAK